MLQRPEAIKESSFIDKILVFAFFGGEGVVLKLHPLWNLTPPTVF